MKEYHRRLYQRYLKKEAVTFLNKESPTDKVTYQERVSLQNLILTNPCYPVPNIMVFHGFLC